MTDPALPRLEFWYDFASTYSYPASMRVEELAARSGVEISWQPFLLGSIFAEQNWLGSPFNIYPRKGRYMWRDMERICEKMKLPLRKPDPFPQNSLLAARVTLTLPEHQRGKFTRLVYAAEFGEGKVISNETMLGGFLAKMKLEPPKFLTLAITPEIKQQLKHNSERANALGLIGAPSFVTRSGEVFWGNDRLEDALEWALRE